MFSLALILCVLGAQALLTIPEKVFYDLEQAEQHFEDFIKTYNKHYATEAEKKMRFEIFKRNLIDMNEKNKKHDLTVYAINKFADLETEEFRRMYMGLKLSKESPCKQSFSIESTGAAPESFDWRDQNKVTRVKDQNPCNTCWAFSAIGNVESQYAIVHNETKEFSEQQLADCVPSSGGCSDGGLMSDGIIYAQEAGLMTEQDYPLDYNDDKNCRLDKTKVQVKISHCNQYQVSSEDELKEILYSVGPLSIGVAGDSFQTYHGGLLKECIGDINHGVLLVGYGSDNGTPFWIIKNSWGESWGEKGYIRVLRNKGLCHIIHPGNEIVSAVVV